MTDPFERQTNAVGELPTREQFEEYRELMTSIVRGMGRGVRVARIGERASTKLGTEYYLPGAHTEYRILAKGEAGYPRTERERRYSASYRQAMGVEAGRLLVLASDSVYLPDIDSYSTERRMYRFSWHDETVGVFQAEVLPIDIVSDARTDGEVLLDERKDGDGKMLLILDHERTVSTHDPDASSGYHRAINPWRTEQSPWRRVDEVEFDVLLGRTDEFGRDLLSD